MKKFNFYETINELTYAANTINCEDINVLLEFNNSFSFIDSNQEFDLEFEQVNGIDDFITYKLIDSHVRWDETSFNYLINLKINDAYKLFGENGYVYSNAKIGVGIEWKTNKSRIKKCCKLGVFSYGEELVELNKNILVNDFFNDTSFELLFYIEEEGTKNCDKTFANKKGLVILKTEFLIIKKSGNGSTFPIVDYSDKNGPLWKVEVDYVDINEDDFIEENVKIMLNKEHTSYKFINSKDKNFNIKFLNEIMSSALSSMLLTILQKEEWALELNDDALDGSISQALRYFRDCMGFDYTSISSVHETVRKFMDRSFK